MVDSPTLIAVASAGHSGSTLLDLLVGNHSQACSAGEMNRLTLYESDRICACGAVVTDCDYWTAVRAAITKRRHRDSLIRWDECHTDVPLQEPLLRLPGASTTQFVDGAPLPVDLRRRLLADGVSVTEGAVLSRHGVRDFKWTIRDTKPAGSYVLREGRNCVEVYSASAPGKNPLRMVPSPLEVVLALGAGPALRVLCANSSRAARYIEIAKNSWAVADAMATVSATRFVIDSSKSPVRLKLLYMLRSDRVRILHLVRDGRAVAASAMRRRRIPAAAAARMWQRDNRNIAVMLRSIPARFKLVVRYEDLCEDPVKELTRVCDFIGVPFESGMATLSGRPVHNIPGNPMLFDRNRRSVRKDERWRQQLVESDVRAIEHVAGRFNRSLGYV